MDNDEVFQKLEDNVINTDNDETIEKSEQSIQGAFVTGLPDWDLEPPFDTIKRGIKK